MARPNDNATFWGQNRNSTISTGAQPFPYGEVTVPQFDRALLIPVN